MSTFILSADDEREIQRFASEVAPAVRERVEAVRLGGEPAPAPPADGRAQAVRGRPDARRRRPAERRARVGRRHPPRRPGARPRRALLGRPAGRRPAPDRRPRRAPRRARPAARPDRAGRARGVRRRRRPRLPQPDDDPPEPVDARRLLLSYCRIVAGHHTLEDRSVFPHLRSRDPRLGDVIGRLEEEHDVISGLLDRIDGALVAMVEPGATAWRRCARRRPALGRAALAPLLRGARAGRATGAAGLLLAARPGAGRTSRARTRRRPAAARARRPRTPP